MVKDMRKYGAKSLELKSALLMLGQADPRGRR